MNNIIYIVGLVVVVIAVLSFFGFNVKLNSIQSSSRLLTDFEEAGPRIPFQEI